MAEYNQPTYIFPKSVAASMAQFKQKTQYEAQMLSTSLLTFGVALSAIYFLIYFDFAIWYKVILAINGVAGVVLLGMATIAVYQQYIAFMAALEFQKQMNPKSFKEPQLDEKTIRKVRSISAASFFFIGLALVIAGVFWWYMSEPVLYKLPLIIIGMILVGYGIHVYTTTNEFIKSKSKKINTNSSSTSESDNSERRLKVNNG